MRNFHFEEDTKNFIRSICRQLKNNEKKVNIKSLIVHNGFVKTDKLEILVSLQDKKLIKIGVSPYIPIWLSKNEDDINIKYQPYLTQEQREMVRHIMYEDITVDDELIHLYKTNFQSDEGLKLDEMKESIEVANDLINTASIETQNTLKESAHEIATAIEEQGTKTGNAIDGVGKAIEGGTKAIKDLKPSKFKVFLDKFGALVAIITAIASLIISVADCSNKSKHYKEIEQKIETMENEDNIQNQRLYKQIKELEDTLYNNRGDGHAIR